MRVVNENLWRLLLARHAGKASANTRCDAEANVFLFDKHIARLKNVVGSVHGLSNWEFNLCGYHTVTTLDRLNALQANIGWVKGTSLIWLRHGVAYRGPKDSHVPCPRGVDPKAHGALHYAPHASEPVPEGWFDAYREPRLPNSREPVPAFRMLRDDWNRQKFEISELTAKLDRVTDNWGKQHAQIAALDSERDELKVKYHALLSTVTPLLRLARDIVLPR